MPFDPNVPAAHAELTSEMFRNQFNALNDKFETLKLPDFTTIGAPVPGNLAFDYTNEVVMVYAHGEWCTLAIG